MIRVVLKTIIWSCQICKNQDETSIPRNSISFIGIDYIGQITVSIGRRKEKRWGVFLTCLTIRAIHIEVAHGFLYYGNSKFYCVARYTSKFIVTRQLTIEPIFMALITSCERSTTRCLQEKFTSSSMKWIFNPPASPHNSLRQVITNSFFLWNWDFSPESFYAAFQWRSEAVRVFQFLWQVVE